MTLTRSSFIKAVPKSEEIPLDGIYHSTPFALCHLVADSNYEKMNLLFAVIHALPPRFTAKNNQHLQEFVIVNKERRQTLITLWDEYFHSEAASLTNNVDTMPIVLGMRLSVNTFRGLSISTLPDSTLLFHPPIPQTEQLSEWVKSNRDYIRTVISERWYEKDHQKKDYPIDSQIRKIEDILAQSEMMISYYYISYLKLCAHFN